MASGLIILIRELLISYNPISSRTINVHRRKKSRIIETQCFSVEVMWYLFGFNRICTNFYDPSPQQKHFSVTQPMTWASWFVSQFCLSLETCKKKEND
jgi:hypothetical protein